MLAAFRTLLFESFVILAHNYHKGPVLVNFENCQFKAIPGPFEYFSEKIPFQKFKVFLIVYKEQVLPLLGLGQGEQL